MSGAGSFRVSSSTVEKTRTEKRQEKRKEDKKKKKGSSSDPANSDVGDPSATPPSAPENERPIYFQYAEGSMNLKMMVRVDFDASPTSLEMKQVCVQVSDIYCSRLGITSSVSDMKFNFTSLAPDHMLVSLKDDEMGLGFEDQVKTCRTSLSKALVNNETLEQSLCKFQAQPEVRSVDFEMFQSRLSVTESTISVLKGESTECRQEIQSLKQEIQTLKQQNQIHQSYIDQLLSNAEFQYATRSRILIQDARKTLLQKLGLMTKKEETWEEFINNLSPEEKVTVGVTDDVLGLMASGMYALNKAFHMSDNDKEMAHAVNNIRNKAEKTSFQALFTFHYNKNPEDVEFSTVVAKS